MSSSGAELYQDRRHAGRRLATKLETFLEASGEEDVIVLALPRGGVPVAFEVARRLSAPLDVMVVRKLGVPGHEGLAMGAVASGDVRVLNEHLIRGLRITTDVVDAVADREAAALQERERSYRGERRWPSLRGRTVILVDDGLATGPTMRAAIVALRQQGPARIVVAVPIASAETCADIGAEVDEIVCAVTPPWLLGASPWYRNYSPTTDAEVRELLLRA